MKILITSGGLREYIDDVRVLTNISTGKLGARIAEAFAKHKHQVTYIHGVGAEMPDIDGIFTSFAAKTCDDAMAKIQRHIVNADAVVHSMAVSDYTFNLSRALKVSSRSADEFITHLQRTIKPNPKIILKMKEWNPSIRLIGFKFEVGRTHKELIEIAKRSAETNQCDLVVANDKAEIQREANHVAHLVDPKFDVVTTVKGKLEIADAIVEWLEKKTGLRSTVAKVKTLKGPEKYAATIQLVALELNDERSSKCGFDLMNGMSCKDKSRGIDARVDAWLDSLLTNNETYVDEERDGVWVPAIPIKV